MQKQHPKNSDDFVKYPKGVLHTSEDALMDYKCIFHMGWLWIFELEMLFASLWFALEVKPGKEKANSVKV